MIGIVKININYLDEIKNWYTRLGFIDGFPYHQGEEWMHLINQIK
jgi:hypothetical protein